MVKKKLEKSILTMACNTNATNKIMKEILLFFFNPWEVLEIERGIMLVHWYLRTEVSYWERDFLSLTMDRISLISTRRAYKQEVINAFTSLVSIITQAKNDQVL